MSGDVEQAHERQTQQQMFGHNVLLVLQWGSGAIKGGADGASVNGLGQCDDELWRKSGIAPRRDSFAPDLG